ncbi:MAG: vWA domain-containing protein [Planctomycetaceae bacterium]
MRGPGWVALLFSVAAFAGPGDDAAARARFLAAFRGDADPAARLEAIGELARSDSPQAAQTLLETWDDLEKEALKRRKELHAVLLKLRTLEGDRLRTGVYPSTPERTELVKREAELSGAQMQTDAEQGAVLAGIRALRSTEALAWLADEGIAKVTSPLLLHEISLHLVSSQDTGISALIVALERARRPEQLVPLLTALERRGREAGPSAVPTLLRLLPHGDWVVRAAVARAMAALALPECVGPLVEAVQKEKRDTRGLQEFIGALQILTGQPIGPFPDIWARWYADRRDDVLNGRIPLGRGKAGSDEAGPGGRFYGIPQDSLRIVYVLDISGSMEVSFTNPKWVDNLPVPPKADEESRFSAARSELLRATKSLRSGTHYAVLLFSDHVFPLHDDLVPVSEKAHARLTEDLSASQPGGNTNIRAAMEAAVRLSGVHPDEPAKDARADAIFLVSDGGPTDALGNREDPEWTLQAVRNWNALRRVTVHTIGIGREHGAGFLRALAEQNGGRYLAVVPEGK